ncbi:unnamed protein product [Rhizoctonia solani]|uniref:Peptidase S33 tripeptidyl aminopeptidase-like C-terminal domain-containing protein n=1 Tax=Rhizoctonia solani TaxID=456999 RepID=A0A8H3BQA3_9AGAM|nr:unnamed protein product [Rhizoctonia solani]
MARPDLVLGLGLILYLAESCKSAALGTKPLLKPRAAGDVEWYQCSNTTDSLIECGTIVIPLDYFNPSAGTATIALSKYKARSSPKKGTVFLGAGGPGDLGQLLAIDAGEFFSTMRVGTDYDIIGFDHRGMGSTTPTVACFKSRTEKTHFIEIQHSRSVHYKVFELGYTQPPNITKDPFARLDLVLQYRQVISMFETQARLCTLNMPDGGASLKYMGTSTVARDIEYMSKVITGPHTPINYYGGSYGSILGSYLINMRVKFSFRSVLAASQLMVLRTRLIGPRSTHASGWTVGSTKLKSTTIASLLLGILRSRTWPTIAGKLKKAMNGDPTAIMDDLVPDQNRPVADKGDLYRYAVTCLDSLPFDGPSTWPTAEKLADAAINRIRDVSPHFGISAALSEADGGCEFWPAKGVERFTGPWNHTLANPILVASTMVDPITPLTSAKLVNQLLGNSSRLLIQNNAGHVTLSGVSTCTAKVFLAYFGNGTLPEDGTVCETDTQPFGLSSPVNTRKEAVELSKWKEALHDRLFPARRWL